MDEFPAERPPKVVEPEVVGLEKPPSWGRRLLARVGLAAVLGCLGLGLLVFGALLTATLVGAAVGVPLLLVGVVLLAGAAFVLLGGGTVVVRKTHP
jgi:hypothetical protein